MSSNRKEEERNEKIIRGLLKLPPNRRCINCNSLGPQYVCTDFWTFVCMTCSGIHREFTHRVKSVSMAKFIAQEVEALQKGGNQRARETFLKGWDLENKKLPDSSKADKIREFIQHVYVDKKFVDVEYHDKLPRNIEILKSCGDYRRSSSYHSYSQSPPNDHQYGRKLHGKQFANHARKPGSDGGHYGGKIFSFVRRQITFSDRPHGERHPTENSNLSSRTSDHSMATAVDKFRLDGHPPNSKQDLHGLPHSERTSSSSSTGSYTSNSKTLRAVNSAAAEALVSPLSQSSSCANATNGDLFSQHAVEASMVSSAGSVDMFTDLTHQQSPSDSLAQEISAYPFLENDRWATFDTFHHTGPTTGTNNQLPRLDLPVDQYLHADAFASMHGYSSECFSTNGSANHLAFPTSDRICLDEIKMPANPKTSQQWNAFEDNAMENNSCTLFSTPLQNNGSQVEMNSNKKSTNPFDLPYDSDQEINTEFMDIFSMQEALPNLHSSSAFSGSTSEPWHPREPVTHDSSSVPPGIAYIAEQLPRSQLLNIQPQAPVSLIGGNPFA